MCVLAFGWVVQPSHPSIVDSNDTPSIQNCHLVTSISGHGATDEATAIRAACTQLVSRRRTESGYGGTPEVPDTRRPSRGSDQRRIVRGQPAEGGYDIVVPRAGRRDGAVVGRWYCCRTRSGGSGEGRYDRVTATGGHRRGRRQLPSGLGRPREIVGRGCGSAARGWVLCWTPLQT